MLMYDSRQAESMLIYDSRQAESALMYDSVLVFARALTALQDGGLVKPSTVSCSREQPWSDGSSLFNYINTVRIPRSLPIIEGSANTGLCRRLFIESGKS